MSSAPLAGDWRHDHVVVPAHVYQAAWLPSPATFDVAAMRARRWIESLSLGNGTEGRQEQLRYLSGRNVLGQVCHSSERSARLSRFGLPRSPWAKNCTVLEYSCQVSSKKVTAKKRVGGRLHKHCAIARMLNQRLLDLPEAATEGNAPLTRQYLFINTAARLHDTSRLPDQLSRLGKSWMAWPEAGAGRRGGPAPGGMFPSVAWPW